VHGPKLSLKVVSANFSLSQNLTRYSKFRVCVREPLPMKPLLIGLLALAIQCE